MTLQIKDRRAVPEGRRKTVPTPRGTSEGRESAGGEGGGSKYEGPAEQDSKSLRGVALGADRDRSPSTESGDVIAKQKPRTQSPQLKCSTLTLYARCHKRNVEAARRFGADGSQNGRRWGSQPTVPTSRM